MSNQYIEIDLSNFIESPKLEESVIFNNNLIIEDVKMAERNDKIIICFNSNADKALEVAERFPQMDNCPTYYNNLAMFCLPISEETFKEYFFKNADIHRIDR